MAIEQFTRSLPMMLNRSLDAVMPRFRKIFNDFGLTEQQWRVLRVLGEQQNITLNELSELTLIPAPSLVGVIDRLQITGLAGRRRSDTDRRKVYVLATRKGSELEARIRPQVASTYAALKQSIDVETWDQALRGLQQIAALGEPTSRRKTAPK
jgi:homoprotocatechuate degradation regulator HpaR